jgi:hypothetical protein
MLMLQFLLLDLNLSRPDLAPLLEDHSLSVDLALLEDLPLLEDQHLSVDLPLLEDQL